jgi:hypothetical protein
VKGEEDKEPNRATNPTIATITTTITTIKAVLARFFFRKGFCMAF